MRKSIIAVIAAICLLGVSDLYARGGYRPSNRRPDKAYYGRNGIELSIGYANSNYRTRDITTENREGDKALHGFYVGVTKDFVLVRRALYFQTGAEYSYLNSSSRFDVASLKVISDRNEHYLDVPARLKLAMDVLPNLRAFVYAGPTLNFGLSSKLYERCKLDGDKAGKFVYNYYTQKTKENSIPGYAPDLPFSKYRAFDVEMGFAIGAEIYDIAVVKLGFDWGLINKNKNKDIADYWHTHRNTFTLGVGVRF